MAREETHADETATGVVTVGEERSDALRVEPIGAGAAGALQSEARCLRALVLRADPERDFVRVQIALERCECSGRDRGYGLGGCQRRRDLSDCSKPRRR
jgi:hypothetical protein